jgi:hypothetical protein
MMLFALSQTYTRAGRFEEGLSAGLAAIRERPTYIQSYPPVIRCLVALDRLAEACEFAAQLLKVAPDFKITKYAATAASRPSNLDALRLAGLPE